MPNIPNQTDSTHTNKDVMEVVNKLKSLLPLDLNNVDINDIPEEDVKETHLILLRGIKKIEGLIK